MTVMQAKMPCALYAENHIRAMRYLCSTMPPDAWRRDGTSRTIQQRRRGSPVSDKITDRTTASLAWRKSGFCDNSSGNCVEVAMIPDAVMLRDSKTPDGPVLIYTRAEWDAFLMGAKLGEFDN